MSKDNSVKDAVIRDASSNRLLPVAAVIAWNRKPYYMMEKKEVQKKEKENDSFI